MSDGLTSTRQSSASSCSFREARVIDMLMVTAEGQLIAATCDSHNLCVIDKEEAQVQYVALSQPIQALAGSPDGHNLLIVCTDGSVIYWHIKDAITLAEKAG